MYSALTRRSGAYEMVEGTQDMTAIIGVIVVYSVLLFLVWMLAESSRED